MNENLNEGKLRKGGKTKKVVIAILIILILALIAGACLWLYKNKNAKVEVKKDNPYLAYRMAGNSLENFDLYFLQLENGKTNKVYSPLSIKYALQMLKEGANGESKTQISNIVGKYKSKKYVNSQNMSFANAMFVRDTFKDSIKTSYTDVLRDRYDAEVIYDSFASANSINTWVNDKTLKLIDKLYDDTEVVDLDFVLTNALAIDMEWVEKIRSKDKPYTTDYVHEKDVNQHLENFMFFDELSFNDSATTVNSIPIAASANKYDIIKELGEDKIRQIVSDEYNKWKTTDEMASQCLADSPDMYPSDTNQFVDAYVKEISTNYNKMFKSTDFYFADNENVKAFAKDLKEYDGTTLQYIGIMPKQVDLDMYIKDIDANKVNEIMNSLKPAELNSFKEGTVTSIEGKIPVFKFDYDLDLKNDLNKLGITDVFDGSKADLSNLTSGEAVISRADHKANIDFSNDGIKAAAVSAAGGMGAAGGCFKYDFEVPIEKIDLTFDKPYMFIIRDKDTGEVWFAGTVYEPTKFENSAPPVQ